VLAHISANTLIWLSLFGPMLVIAGLGFTARHVSDVLFPSFGEEA
jgi:hypothetical protein